MAILSGASGSVTKTAAVVVNIGKWNVSHTGDTAAQVVSGGASGTTRIAANKDWSGSYEANGHTPAIKPGEEFTFLGSIDGTNGATGEAICNQVEVVIDIEAGAIIGHTVNFESNGALTLGISASADTGVPDPTPAVGCKVEKAAAIAEPIYAEITDVRTVTLTITRSNPSYRSSATAGETKRHAGNWDCTVAISVYDDDYADLPQVHEIQDLKLWVNATEFWQIQWAIVNELTDLEVDVGGPNLIGGTINYEFTGHTQVPALGTALKGKINAPGAVTWW